MQGILIKYRCSIDENDASLAEIEVGFMQRMNSGQICVLHMEMMTDSSDSTLID